MAHFAELDKNNEVLQVIVVDDKNCLDKSGRESEDIGIAFLHGVYGNTKRIFKQTSYNETIRKNFAAIGYKWDDGREAFVAPKCDIGDWEFNEQTCKWVDVSTTKASVDAGRKSFARNIIDAITGKQITADVFPKESPWYRRLWIKLCNYYHKLFSK